MDRPLSDGEVRRLVYAALSISDKLGDDGCGSATFSGSTNDVDEFRETINHLWHRISGWVEKNDV